MSGFFARLKDDFRATREFVKANSGLKDTQHRTRAAEGQLRQAHAAAGKIALGANAGADLPAFGAAHTAQAQLAAAEATAAERQAATESAQKHLADQEAKWTAAIALLQKELVPLKAAASEASGNLKSAEHELATNSGQVTRTRGKIDQLKSSATDKPEDELSRELAARKDARDISAARLQQNQQTHAAAKKVSGEKASELKSAEKAYRRAQSQAQSELASAEKAAEGREAAVKAAQEKLAAVKAEHEPRVAQLADAVRDADAAVAAAQQQVDAAKQQLSSAEADLAAATDRLTYRQLTTRLAELEAERKQLDAKSAAAGEVSGAASAAQAKKSAELEGAKQEWKTVGAQCQEQLSAAQTQEAHAKAAVPPAKAGLEQALVALGEAVYEHKLSDAALAAPVVQITALLEQLVHLSAEAAGFSSRMQVARGGARRFGITIGVAAAIVLVLTVCAILFFTRHDAPKQPSPPTPASSPTTAREHFSSPSWAMDLSGADIRSIPATQPAGKEIARQQVQPGDQEQTVALGQKVKVIIPAGQVAQPADLVLAEAPAMASPSDDLKPLVSYQVSLGDRHEFAEPLVVEIPYDPAQVPAGRSPDEVFVAAYWHEHLKAWVALPVEAKEGKLRTYTRHLTILSWWFRGPNWFLHDAVKTEHFMIWYSAKGLADPTSGVNDAAWSAAVGAETAAGFAPLSNDHKAGVPLYVEYVANALEYAYSSYKTKGLRVPTWAKRDVFVGVGGFGTDPYHTKFFGSIYLPPARLNTPRTVRMATAHELCHAVQSEYLSFDMMAMTLRKWWLEATAEGGAKLVWGDAVDFQPMDRGYLTWPVTSEAYLHDYDSGQFVRWLVERKNTSFKQMLEDTLNVGTGVNAAEMVAAVDYAIVHRLIGNQEPFDSYTRAVTLNRLEDLYLRRHETLVDQWREFVGYLLFDPASPLGTGDPEMNVQTSSRLDPTDTETGRKLSPGKDYAVYIWSVQVRLPPGAPNDGTRAIKITTEKDADLPTGFVADVYLLKGNKRLAGAKPAGTIAANNATREVPLKVAADEEVYVVATNYMSKPVEVTLKAANDVTLSLDPSRIPDAKTGQLYMIKALAQYLPQETKDFRLRWDFGDGTKDDVDKELDRATAGTIKGSYSHKFDKPGTYKVTVQVIEGLSAKVRADAVAEVVIGNQPAIRLTPADIHAQTNVEVEINASVDNAPPKAHYMWSLGNAAKDTAAPAVKYVFPVAGKVDISIALVEDSTNKTLATAKGTVNVEDGEELKWVKTYHPNGKLWTEYQVLVATGARHGISHSYYDNGIMGEDAIYKRGNMVRVKRWWDTGKMQYDANFNDNGKLNGVETTYYENGNKKAESSWLAQPDIAPSLKDGVFCGYHQDGSLAQQMTFVQDKLHGPMKQLAPPDAQGKQVVLQEGNWGGGNRVGKWVFRKDTRRLEENYVEGKRQGIARRFQGDRVYVEEEYENNEVHIRRTYDDDGKLKEEEKDPHSTLYW